jgi:hypothetical protein
MEISIEVYLRKLRGASIKPAEWTGSKPFGLQLYSQIE